jgi:hypothetical protein
MRYSGDQNALLDREDENHQVIPGSWRDEVNLQDIEDVRDSNYPSKETATTLLKALLFSFSW